MGSLSLEWSRVEQGEKCFTLADQKEIDRHLRTIANIMVQEHPLEYPVRVQVELTGVNDTTCILYGKWIDEGTPLSDSCTVIDHLAHLIRAQTPLDQDEV